MFGNPDVSDMSRKDLWRIYQQAKTFGRFPSEVVALSIDEFLFNEAVSSLGVRIENILNAHYDEKKGQHRPELPDLLSEPGEAPVDLAETEHAQDWVCLLYTSPSPRD